MIEKCPDLPQCEAILSQEIKKVSLIGELRYSSQDLTHLAQLVRAKITPDSHAGTRYLEHQAPTSLACLLVWIGIENYAGNTYWPAVERFTGLSDPNWQSRWGRVFLDVLHAHNLPLFDIEGSTTYVTPILGHGGIPSACLPEFFEQVLTPLVERDLADPANAAAIVEELTLRREAEVEHARIEAGLTSATRQIEALQLQLQRQEVLMIFQKDLEHLRNLETKTEIPIQAATLPTDYPAFRADIESQRQEFRQAAQLMQERRRACESVIAAFSPLDRQVLALRHNIDQARVWQQVAKQAQDSLVDVIAKQAELTSVLDKESHEVFDGDWQDDYGQILATLPLAELRQAIEHYVRIEGRCARLAFQVVNTRNQKPIAARRREPPRFGLTRLFAWLGSILFSTSATPRGYGDSAVGLENELARAISAREQQRRTIASILDGLPIRQPFLLDPDVILCEKLETLRKAFETRLTYENERQGLIATQAQSSAEITAVAKATGLEFADTDRVVEKLETSLRVADEHQRAAEQATATLNEDVTTQLAALAKKQTQLEDELYQVDLQLVALGNGSVEQGLLRLANARAADAEAGTLRARLNQTARDIPDLRRLLDEKGRDHAITTGTELDAIRQGLVQAEREKHFWKAEREHVPGVWTGIDEPIRRFLLYGDDNAEQFLVKTVKLYSSYGRKAAAQTPEIDLPPRVVDAFDEWYRQKANRNSPESSQRPYPAGYRVGDPFIYLDTENQTVMLRLPTQSLVELPKAERAWLEVTADNHVARSERWPLRAYRGHDLVLQTQELAVPLPIPAEAYRLCLTSGEEVCNTWALPGFEDRHYLLFDAISGRSLLVSELAPERVHVVLRRDFRLEPESAVLDSFLLVGEWHEFVVHTVDPTSIDALRVIHMSDTSLSYSLAVSAEARGTFRLLGGTVLEGAVSNLRPVFTHPPEAIRTPLRTEAELRYWRLLIIKTDQLPVDTRSLRLSDLLVTEAVRFREGCFDIDLSHGSLLGPRAAGEYTVRLRKLPHRDWACEFVVLPGFDVHFEQPVYLPYPAGKAPSVRVTVTQPQVGTISVLRPARTTDISPARLVVELPQQESVLLMTVALSQTIIAVAVLLPKIYWRLHGLGGNLGEQWHDQGIQEEWWLDDWQGLSQLYLTAGLPPTIDGQVYLSLNGDPAREDHQLVHHSEARFDLLAFRDALRAGPSVREFSLGFVGSSASFGPVSLFQIRWQWEVYAVECLQESRGTETLLTISWQELGKTDGQHRLVRLWRAEEMASVPRAQVRVLEGQQQVQFQLHNHQVPPGNYFLQFQLEDPWWGDSVSRPDRAGVNCHEIIIVKKDEINEGRLIKICAVRWLPSPRNFAPDPLLPGMYHIRIVGRVINRELPPVENAEGVLVTRLNEGWYVGHLEVPPGKGLDDEMIAANPLKFEYDVVNREITAIEDKSGDGAMYCRECRLLFWSAEKIREEESRHKRHLRGPIEHFDVEWL